MIDPPYFMFSAVISVKVAVSSLLILSGLLKAVLLSFFGFLVDFYGNQAPIVKARQFLNDLIFLEHFFSLQQQVLAGRESLSEQSA